MARENKMKFRLYENNMEYKYIGTAVNPDTKETAFVYQAIETGKLFYSPIKLRETVTEDSPEILLG